MTGKVASKHMQKLCEDCILRKSCEYIPDEYELIRCLDKVTGKEPSSRKEEEAE